MQVNPSLAAMLDELSSLRRYLRALTGSRAGGDFLIDLVEQVLSAAPLEVAPEANAKRALFRFFYAQVWPDFAVTNASIAMAFETDADPGAEARFALQVPLSRHAEILQAVEQFTEDDVNAMFDRLRRDVANIEDIMVLKLAEQDVARVLIIEDEPIIAMDIEMIVGDLGHIVVGTATTRNEALGLASDSAPDLILSDIHLADGSSGIDVVAKITKTKDVPVVFITAFPESLLTGRKHEPSFLIEKPFKPAAVEAIITQALFSYRRRHPMK